MPKSKPSVIPSSNSTSSKPTKGPTNPGALIVLLSVVVGFVIGRTGIGGSSGGSTVCTQQSSITQTRTQTDAIDSSSSSIADEHDRPGWHDVHVYYGDREALLAPHLVGEANNRSQEGQDMYALNLLNNQRGGFFVDLAANHPILLSNTFLLERDYDWKGLCIEPNWQYWNALATLRKCKVIGAVGGGSKSEAIQFRFHPFKRYAGAFGGIVGDQYDNKEAVANKDKNILEEERFTVALGDILDSFGAPTVIDYLSLDVEGAEDLIMTDFPFHKYTFRVLNVERPKAVLETLLKDNGYIFLRRGSFGDEMWKHKSLE